MMDSQAKTILVVEDDQGILFVLSAFLRDEGFEVREAENGSAALENIEKHGMPRLILLDMLMPVMNGWQFASELVQRFGKRNEQIAPIVVMSAAADAQQRARDIRAVGWVGKPFVLDELLALIGKHMASPEFLA